MSLFVSICVICAILSVFVPSVVTQTESGDVIKIGDEEFQALRGNCWGNTLGLPVNNATLSACLLACSALGEGCIGSSFEEGLAVCYTKSKLCIEPTTRNTKWRFYSKRDPLIVSYFNETLGDCYGNFLPPVERKYLKKPRCAEACLKNPNCSAFSFTGTYYCVLKTKGCDVPVVPASLRIHILRDEKFRAGFIPS